MKGEIILLTDYQDRFGSKHNDVPYRSGMDKDKLTGYFRKAGYETVFINFSEVDFNDNDWKGRIVLYTSSEDPGYHYKDYIEDIVYGLELAGARVIPSYKYLRANNNKVFMEILRSLNATELKPGLKTRGFGVYEEMDKKINDIAGVSVIKKARGASGSGVFLSSDSDDLKKKVKKLSRTRHWKSEIRDLIRSFRHHDYRRESLYRNKFVLQDFIPGLKNDWKIYVFGKKLYIFYRPILKGRGIKASGGGYDNYYYGQEAKAPDKIFDFANKIFAFMNVPHASLDIAYDGNHFYLIEFQMLYFGTAGIPYSDGYYSKQNKNWQFIKEKLAIEKVYADSIIEYINQ